MNEPFNDPRVALLSVGLKALHEDLSEMKATIKELAAVVIKLALVEERQERAMHTQKHMLNLIDKISERLTELERARPDTERMSRWFERGLWAVVVTVAVFIGKKTGLL